MKIKHAELEIPREEPFKNCKLERVKYGKILAEVIGIYADGFVLAINNEWGTGKTTFVKMWAQELSNRGYRTVYFNAWENDFNLNPLSAIMSELKSIMKKGKNGEKMFKSLVEKGSVLVRNVAPSLIKAVMKKYVVDIDEIDTAGENTTKAITEVLEAEVKEYSLKKETIIEFKKELEVLIKSTESSKPLVYIIDELDRCRPNYAVELLEQMKHFFSVPGIIFVLSIDKNHLASSVQGFYGSHQINTDEYLRRFIDLEYSMPRPSNEAFCKYLFGYYAFNEFFYSQERQKYNEFQYDADQMITMATLLFNKSNATLRQQEKIFGLTRLILSSFNSNQYIFSSVLFVLIFVKTMRNKLYETIVYHRIGVPDLAVAFAELVPNDVVRPSNLNLVYVQGLLLTFYNNDRENEGKIELFSVDGYGKLQTSIRSGLDSGNDKHVLAECFRSISNQWDYRGVGLSHFINKIELMDPVNVS